MIVALFAWTLGLLTMTGIGYTLFAAHALRRFAESAVPETAAEAVSLLKPLYGAEPRLADNLATFFAQDWAAPVEMVAGVSDLADPAAAVARAAGATLVTDATRHGANGKVSNLINMAPATTHDVIVLSDSDMAVPRRYLATVVGALSVPGTGAVTCLYRGRGDAGRWSVLAAAMASYQFLPSVVVGLRLGLAKPCMGSTIAFRRATLDAIGGFGPFADLLADDYAIGAAVRAQGLTIAVPPLILVHCHDESHFVAVWRHELRWSVTLKRLDPAGFAGSVVTFPVALALLAIAFAPIAGAALLIAALVARAWLKRRIDEVAGEATAAYWQLPVRDLLSFAVFVATFFVRSVDWRGERLTMLDEGRVSAERSSHP